MLAVVPSWVQTMMRDVVEIWKALFGGSAERTPTLLVGHSMGGALAVWAAATKEISGLDGLVVIDVVEGTALGGAGLGVVGGCDALCIMTLANTSCDVLGSSLHRSCCSMWWPKIALCWTPASLSFSAGSENGTASWLQQLHVSSDASLCSVTHTQAHLCFSPLHS